MSMQSTIDAHRDGAECYTGGTICREKTLELLAELHLPNGLLPLSDLVEVGYNRSTGFVWNKRKEPITHTFDKIGKTVSYEAEVTAFVEDRRMKELTGVKTKELLLWITLSEFHIDEKDLEMITFKTPTGLYRTFPVTAFVVE